MKALSINALGFVQNKTVETVEIFYKDLSTAAALTLAIMTTFVKPEY